MQSGKAAEIVGAFGSPLLETLEDKRQTLAADMVKYRDQLRKAQLSERRAAHRIRKMLRAYHLVLACAVRQKLNPSADITLELGRLGFLCEGAAAPAAERGDLIVGGLGVMAASLFLLVMGAGQAGSLWNASPGFPASALDAFLWTASAVSAHGVAILLADRMRTRAIARGRWYRTGAGGRVSPLANLIRVALRAAPGYLCWYCGAQSAGPDAALFRAWPHTPRCRRRQAVLRFHLDNIELRPAAAGARDRPAGVVTAFFGLVACSAWFALVRDNPHDSYDLIVMVTIFGALIGGSLGWYIRRPCRRTRRRARGRAAERAPPAQGLALAHFDDANAARQWFDHAFVQLANRTPRVAASESVADMTTPSGFWLVATTARA